MIDLTKKHWQYLTLIFLSIIWGSSFILIKRGLESYTGLQVASLRMFIAFLVLIPFIPKAIKKISKKHLPYLIFIAIIGNGVTAFLFAYSQQYIDSSLAGMLNATTPISTYIIGIIFYKIIIKKQKILGLIVGLAGTILLLFLNTKGIVNNNIIYMFLLILAASFYSANVNMVKFNLTELSGFTITVITFAIVGPAAGIIFFNTDLQAAQLSPTFIPSTIYIILLSLFSSVFALLIFNILIKYTSTIFSSTVTYLIPIVATIWGFIDGEKISIFEITAVLIIIAGIYLVNKEK